MMTAATAAAMGSGYRITYQLMREPYSLGFSSKLRHHRRRPRFAPSPPPPAGSISGVSVRCFQSNCCHGELSVLSDSFSQKEDDHGTSSDGLTSVAGGIVALGKFDALHIGHRELAVQASKVGAPFLLSFVGMAEVLGWKPRAPIVAKYDRKRVLSSWSSHCGNLAPREVLIEFSSVRHLSPRQFVEKLSEELGVRGVVAGENYRFGYKAAGDASELVKLCNEYGIGAYIIDSVMDKHQDFSSPLSNNGKERGQVSSTRVRHALAMGDMNYVSELLGRRHRLMLSMGPNDGTIITAKRISVPKSRFLNLAPKDGVCENCSLVWADGNEIPCTVNIDTTDIHIELDRHSGDVVSQDFPFLGIEFGDSYVRNQL